MTKQSREHIFKQSAKSLATQVAVWQRCLSGSRMWGLLLVSLVVSLTWAHDLAADKAVDNDGSWRNLRRIEVNKQATNFSEEIFSEQGRFTGLAATDLGNSAEPTLGENISATHFSVDYSLR